MTQFETKIDRLGKRRSARVFMELFGGNKTKFKYGETGSWEERRETIN